MPAEDVAAAPPRPSVRHVEKRRTSTCRWADRIATASLQCYHQYCGGGTSSSKQQPTCVATIVALITNHNNNNDLHVVGLGVGTKFLASSTTTTRQLGDCHAEVLARRAFRRYLSLEMLGEDRKRILLEPVVACSPAPPPPPPQSKQFRLRSNVTLHMYCSSAPCGNAVLKKFCAMKKEVWMDHLTDNEWPVQSHVEIRGHARAMGELALLVKKETDRSRDTPPNESTCNTIPPSPIRHLSRKEQQWPANQSDDWCPPGTTTVWRHQSNNHHTCSDKLCRWNSLGLQGSFLASMLESPLYLSTLTVGRKLSANTMRRAVCCRADLGPVLLLDPPYRVHHPSIMGTAVYMDEEGAIDMSDPQQTTGQDVRFHSSLSYAWWPGLDRAECIDGSTGYRVVKKKDHPTGLAETSSSSSTSNTIPTGGSTEDRTEESSCSDPMKRHDGFSDGAVSSISTLALTELFLEITQKHGVSQLAHVPSPIDRASHTMTLSALRSFKPKTSPMYEQQKDALFRKHPVLRYWKRRQYTIEQPQQDEMVITQSKSSVNN